MKLGENLLFLSFILSSTSSVLKQQPHQSSRVFGPCNAVRGDCEGARREVKEREASMGDCSGGSGRGARAGLREAGTQRRQSEHEKERESYPR
eukprot:32714-Hanusia_phi.AAC.2